MYMYKAYCGLLFICLLVSVPACTPRLSTSDAQDATHQHNNSGSDSRAQQPSQDTTSADVIQIASDKANVETQKNHATTAHTCSSTNISTSAPQTCVDTNVAEHASCQKMKKYADTQQEIEQKEAARKALEPKTERTIKITNNINTKKLDYSKLFVTYTPTTFEVTVNGTLIAPQASAPIKVTGDTVVITYYCEFKDGARKSSHEYTYKLGAKITDCTVTFDWHKEPRIALDDPNAELISDIKVDCDAPSATSAKTQKGS
jgi:hypothetical protein